MTREEYLDVKKALAWDRAKAALAHIVEIEAQRISPPRQDGEERFRHQLVRAAIDKFIHEFEDEGLDQ